MIATRTPERARQGAASEIALVPNAHDLVLQAIAQGKHVVTANKALLAEHRDEVFAAAAQHNVTVAFEGAVAVSIPIVKALREGLAANDVQWLAGIVNGTSNFILTQMREHGTSFRAALAEAQRLGYTIKLLATAKKTEQGVALGVQPTLIPKDSLMSKVDGLSRAAPGCAAHHGPKRPKPRRWLAAGLRCCPLKSLGDARGGALYCACWIPASTQPPLPARGFSRCQISLNGSSGPWAPSRTSPVKRTLTT